MAEIIQLYRELSSVKDVLIQSLKENQDKLSVEHDKLSAKNEEYIKSLKEINILNLKIATLEKEATKHKRFSSSKKILFLIANLYLYFKF